MRTFYYCTIIAIVASCSDVSNNEKAKYKPVISLQTPEVAGGIEFNPDLPQISISAILDSTNAIVDYEIRYDSLLVALHDTINILADKHVPCGIVDSIIDTLCSGKDIRLTGTNNGVLLSIPFHGLRRFSPMNYIKSLMENQYLVLNLSGDSVRFGDKVLNDEALKSWFRSFYGNAFNPKDTFTFPGRNSHEQTMMQLALEGQAWDASPKNEGPDSAIYLASYNEFVNKLEIYDKVGTFYLLDLAFFEFDIAPNTKWGTVMNVFSLHHNVQSELRKEAVRYFEERHANSGEERKKDLTEEDLRLLYPDRLRWNRRMSGTTEHRYDVHHLEIDHHSYPPPPAVIKEEVSVDVPLN